MAIYTQQISMFGYITACGTFSLLKPNNHIIAQSINTHTAFSYQLGSNLKSKSIKSLDKQQVQQV